LSDFLLKYLRFSDMAFDQPVDLVIKVWTLWLALMGVWPLCKQSATTIPWVMPLFNKPILECGYTDAVGVSFLPPVASRMEHGKRHLQSDASLLKEMRFIC
jgi:hypothetical protein